MLMHTQVKRISQAIARALHISGPFNIQFMSRENEVKVIECNLRASRTFPFISKTFDFNFITLATKAMVGLPCRPGTFSLVRDARTKQHRSSPCFAPDDPPHTHPTR